jgi:hypothetical protein
VDRLIEGGNLHAQLSPGREHWTDDRCYVVAVNKHCLDTAVERKSTHGPGQHTENLEHTADVVRQSRRHADQLGSCTE